MTALDASIASSETPAVVAQPATRTRRRRRKPSVFFWLAVAWLAVVVFLAVFAGWLPFVKDWAIRQPGTVKFNRPSPRGGVAGHRLEQARHLLVLRVRGACRS
jgi:hypothetical protein